MNQTIRLLGFLLMALSMSCTKDAEIDLPEYKPTLVIHSYISPMDSQVVVYVNLSKSAYSSNSYTMNNVKDATVKISDGVVTKTLHFFPVLFSDEISYYYIDSTELKITAGKTYTLLVTTPDGKAANATTTIPQTVVLKSIESKLVSSLYGDSVYKMNFTFQDPIGQEDYYKYAAYLILKDTVLDSLVSWSGNEGMATYLGSDGNLITETMEVYRSFNFINPEEVPSIDFRLMHVTREFYLYHQSIQKFGGGPFAEPNVPFTNIHGGVGVFAGFNEEQQMIRLK
ncbi:MAG: DUF4249 domain-containing protein [Bacteroidetes bacterium]|nr:DUF4249 domain-containing protein [Bacteroidota bacterium]